MRYAIFTDIHANLEALEAVLAKIDEIAQEKPIDQIWFLGDLVGYGPNPNECIVALRARTDVIIAGNHDWAAVGKIDLEDFSAAARISAEWTASELTEEHRAFLSDLPERLDIGDCTLVHGSPYGPLWEYLTSEMLAERSFRCFSSRYCFVGHTHVPVIFQQPVNVEFDEEIADTPTLPLTEAIPAISNGVEHGAGAYNDEDDDDEETVEAVAVHSSRAPEQSESAYREVAAGPSVSEGEAASLIEITAGETAQAGHVQEGVAGREAEGPGSSDVVTKPEEEKKEETAIAEEPEGVATGERLVEDEGAKEEEDEDENRAREDGEVAEDENVVAEESTVNVEQVEEPLEEHVEETTPEEVIVSAEEQINSEIEELLTLLGLSQSMIQVTNEMLTPPEGLWQAPGGYRFIINPGGVGQPRDGDPRAAFMIYDTEAGFEFYRVPYDFEKTQEKIIEAGLPQYLAVRLAYGR